MLVDEEFSENTNRKSEVMNVLKVRILCAGSLQDEGIKYRPNGAEEGAMGEIVVPNVTS